MMFFPKAARRLRAKATAEAGGLADSLSDEFELGKTGRWLVGVTCKVGAFVVVSPVTSLLSPLDEIVEGVELGIEVAGDALERGAEVLDHWAGGPDHVATAGAPSADAGTGAVGTATTESQPHFSAEGRYSPGVGPDGQPIIQSSTGPPIEKATGKPVPPSDVTW